MSGHDFTHASLVQRAVKWLQGYHRCTIVYSEMATSAIEIPDAIGWHKGFSRLVECKVSRSDFNKEKRTKLGAIHQDHGMGAQRWYLVPSGLLKPEEVPEWCGLAYAGKSRIQVVKPAPDRVAQDFRGEIQMLMSAVRRLHLGSQFDPVTCKWEALQARRRRQRRKGL